ncbi:patatin-like phospholipase family protein [Fusobacterium sp. PH5-44]|uniref:patatin-like phospholipase family protein n=1 Tax=unclassified Fusobacterium TaxID=2648384 RepID=UPI003D1D5227
MNKTIDKYELAMIFSGGGSRFGIYGGIYSAFLEKNIGPDIIIGTCGGAMGALIVSAFGTSKKIKEYMQSSELYDFICSIKLTKEQKLYKIGSDFLIRALKNPNGKYIEDIFDKYVLNMPEDLEKYLPILSKNIELSIPIVILGTKLLFGKDKVGRKNRGKKLYKKIIFSDENTSNLLRKKIDESEYKESNVFFNSLIDSKIEIIDNISLLKAARISMSDMFYTRPVYYDNNYYLGGAIDLVPIEIAQMISKDITIEKKQKYTDIESLAVNSVFGYDPNERLSEISKYNPKYIIDTTDVPNVLKGHYVTSKINWSKFQVELNLPENYEKFCEDIDIQWSYGYERGMRALSEKKNN